MSRGRCLTLSGCVQIGEGAGRRTLHNTHRGPCSPMRPFSRKKRSQQISRTKISTGGQAAGGIDEFLRQRAKSMECARNCVSQTLCPSCHPCFASSNIRRMHAPVYSSGAGSLCPLPSVSVMVRTTSGGGTRLLRIDAPASITIAGLKQMLCCPPHSLCSDSSAVALVSAGRVKRRCARSSTSAFC